MQPTSWSGPCWVRGGAATAELRALIVQRTGGTPLFIEETVRTLVESGMLRSA